MLLYTETLFNVSITRVPGTQSGCFQTVGSSPFSALYHQPERMSVRIYTNPGNAIFPRPAVVRQYAPGRVSRQVRYSRSLSAPLGLENVFTYAPWETNRKDFTNVLLETKRRDLSNSPFENKQRDIRNDPLGIKQRESTNPLLENRRRELTNKSFETKLRELTVPLTETIRHDYINKTLVTKHRELLIPLSESKRRDFTKNHFTIDNYLENKRRDLPRNYLGAGRTNSYLGNNRTNSCLENGRTNSYLENKKRNDTNCHPDNIKNDLSKNYLENKGRTLDSNDADTQVLAAAPRPFRSWNNQKKLCTIDDLLEIIREPTGHYELPTDPCNEVYPGIVLSDGPTALCTSMLKRMGVSHVLNAAQGKERPGQVNTSPSFYSHSGIRYLGVEAFDHIAFRLHPYFEEASDFIQEALKSGGKVLVHCRAGISRSATLVCAFLMLKKHLSAQEAIRTVRKNRAIIPNDGFLQQLCDLNERLHKTRGP